MVESVNNLVNSKPTLPHPIIFNFNGAEVRPRPSHPHPAVPPTAVHAPTTSRTWSRAALCLVRCTGELLAGGPWLHHAARMGQDSGRVREPGGRRVGRAGDPVPDRAAPELAVTRVCRGTPHSGHTKLVLAKHLACLPVPVPPRGSHGRHVCCMCLLCTRSSTARTPTAAPRHKTCSRATCTPATRTSASTATSGACVCMYMRRACQRHPCSMATADWSCGAPCLCQAPRG